MIFYFAFALLGILLIFALGSKFVIENLFIFQMSFYSDMIIKNFFFIELFFYVCCRSRLSIKYFPRFSILTSITVVYYCWKYYYYDVVFFINLHLIIHLLLISIFALFERLIGNSEFKDDHIPTLEKPRAMYYAGYDISW